jgi:transcriptional regulator with XRE-family HTH domain
MPVRDTAVDQGARRSRFLRTRLAAELETARLAAGLSYRELARQLGVGHELVAKALRADASALTVDFVARLAAVLGLELGASLHPVGDPVRDKAHLALIRRFRARLSPALTWRSEVPIPIAGDRRSADGVISGAGFEILVEAETRLDDVQALERSIAGKQRDLGIGRVILLVADTRHNREVVLRLEELRRLFPIGTRACLTALARGRDPGGDALIIL